MWNPFKKKPKEPLVLTEDNVLEYVREAVKRAEKEAEKNSGKHMYVIGNCTVVFDWYGFFKEHPEALGENRKRLKNSLINTG